MTVLLTAAELRAGLVPFFPEFLVFWCGLFAPVVGDFCVIEDGWHFCLSLQCVQEYCLCVCALSCPSRCPCHTGPSAAGLVAGWTAQVKVSPPLIWPTGCHVNNPTGGRVCRLVLVQTHTYSTLLAQWQHHTHSYKRIPHTHRNWSWIHTHTTLLQIDIDVYCY